MNIVADPARPIIVDSFTVDRHVSLAVAYRAAQQAAEHRASGGISAGRLVLPFDAGWMRLMAAVVPAMNVVGYKEFHLTSSNIVRYAVHLFAIDSGAPLGVVDGALVTTLRTAASATYAAQCFFGSRAEVALGVVGSGAEALAGVKALDAVLRLTSVKVTSRNQANCERFATEVRQSTGLTVQVCTTPEAALARADMAYVATNSGGKVVLGWESVAGLPFVASVGSTIPVQRELGDAVLAKADRVVVDTWDVLEESGDALAARELGLDRSRCLLLGDMPTVAWDQTMGVTVYKSIGSPEQDVTLAASILQLAAEHGFGRPIHPLSNVKKNL